MSVPALALCRDPSPHDIPLFRQLCEDPGIEIVRRAVDQRWSYASAIASPVTGWHLFRPEIYTSQTSALAGWLDHPSGDLRVHNEGDRLIHELLFATHDYLHAWAIREIVDIAPELGVGHKPLCADNLERFAFVQLLTEAAATVGLDYWYLSCIELDRWLDIGSTLRTLTVSYHEHHAAEYQRFNPELRVQSPEFFTFIGDFYCTGRFGGFDVHALRRSPRMLAWLKHELSYGALQRRYTRQWLRHLAGIDQPITSEALAAPIAVDAPWQRSLSSELGQRLWEKVKHDGPARARSRDHLGCDDLLWRAPAEGRLDFRFTNFNALGKDPWAVIGRRGIVRESFSRLVDQAVSAHDFASASPLVARTLSRVRESESVDLLHLVLDQAQPLAERTEFPFDLFVLS